MSAADGIGRLHSLRAPRARLGKVSHHLRGDGERRRGATHYFNPIRKGSIATDESVFDRATGKPLVFDVVGSAIARAGGVGNPDTTQTYIRVTLARPFHRMAARPAC